MDSDSGIWRHEPVMVDRVVELLGLRPGMQILEGFTGIGGHSKRFLEIIGDGGHIWGFELDPRVAREAEKRLEAYKGRFTIFVSDNRHFDHYLAEAGINQIDAAFNDLGLGYYHLGEAYGMALKKDLPIDFRLSPTMDVPNGAEFIESASEAELKRLIWEAGERKFAGRIAGGIVRGRPIRTTGKLARIIEDAVPRKFHKPGVSPAQRIFAHLRVFVNDERGALAEMTGKLTRWLKPGGRVVFLCYTSAELSQVRGYLKGTGCTCPPDMPKCVCGKGYSFKVLADGERPSADEIEANPSARSARLAAGEFLYRTKGEGPKE